MKKLLLFTALAMLFNACRVEVDGCIEPTAINYDRNADIDDGSCIFNSDVVFYEDVAAAVYFDIINVDWLDLYVDGDYIGTLDATLGLNYVPDCFEEDAVAFTLEWYDSETTSFNWSIRDETGFKHYEGIEAIFANDCLPIGLTYKKIQDYKEASK